MHILLISPYHSGSHKAWAEAYAAASAHTVTLMTLPGRFWKWRMHGGTLQLARNFLDQIESGQLSKPDLVLADDMLDFTTFLAVTRPILSNTPMVLYMHENQLTYPLPADPTTGPMRRQRGERDYHYVFINYSSMLAADRIFFNSQYHLDAWFDAMPAYLRQFPEHRGLDNIERLRQKAAVLHVGISPPNPPSKPILKDGAERRPLILWNQRWEYDKNPEDFFAALFTLAERNVAFDVALCGENFSRKPVIFDDAIEKLGDRIVTKGYLDKEAYYQVLHSADIVVSTAHHEFFGISITEAIAHKTFPILPNRLSYPEIIPTHYHSHCLYNTQTELLQLLNGTLTRLGEANTMAVALSQQMQHFHWTTIAHQYDQTLAKIVDISTKNY